ncbi:hypothetical protein HMPREF1624_03491 [Sporothrix schenckii ATCC 58251]|uniref:Uncharacterized protein n=1 Tax=Sporothrix schenckii (strain ATCC 58251 / de Perez 2211183) TaxID=1391915 RepID=U7PYV6_SPOS1|nr:hypothetical protein HMPREF1624_03491 [Sporothrix schenckii ATCC 58251]
MASFHRTSSPVLTMTSQAAHQLPFDRPYAMQQSSPFGNPSAWSQNIGQRKPTAPPRGRKRSRDEAAVNLDPPEKAPPAVEPVKEDEDEWEYGPGMVLIKKGSGYIHDASNQSGTWLEEKAAALEATRKEEALVEQQRQAQDRPSLRSHKSSRLDLSAHIESPESARSSRSSPKRDVRDPSPMTPDGGSSGGASQPVIDDFTLHLGIGWNRLSDDEHIQAAARGWARYIENHYPVTEPKILLESKGLESYLVEAREGYFLFAENLRQGRLVSSNAQRALDNLKSSPPVFDGTQTMGAAGTPLPAEVATALTAGPATATTDVEMDMI